MSDHQGAQNFYNSGDVQIGSQGGVVHGGVHFGVQSPDGGAAASQREQVQQLVAALEAARNAGHIDADTHSEASAALNEALLHADTADEPGQGAFVRALRKAKGLVDEVGGLVAAIAAVIATVAGAR
jgi:hypothetical protein